MYMDIDIWRTLIKITNHSTPKDYGMHVTSQKAKLRGGYKRKQRRKNK